MTKITQEQYEAMSTADQDKFWVDLNAETGPIEGAFWGDKQKYLSMTSLEKARFWEIYAQPSMYLLPEPVVSMDIDPASDDFDKDGIKNKNDPTPFGPRGPFGFFTAEQAMSGNLPPFNSSVTAADDTCTDKCQEEVLKKQQICANVRKRIEKYFENNGCPVTITPIDTTSNNNNNNNYNNNYNNNNCCHSNGCRNNCCHNNGCCC